MEGKDWVESINLEIGDYLTDNYGQSIRIDDIIVSTKPVEVFNIDVEDFDTYFVSDSNILTHNSDEECQIELEEWLDRKQKTPYYVYRGKNDSGEVVYIGITNDIKTRDYQHSSKNRPFKIEQYEELTDLTEGDARTIEQLLINEYGIDNLENKSNSISNKRKLYEPAVEHAREKLKEKNALHILERGY